MLHSSMDLHPLMGYWQVHLPDALKENRLDAVIDPTAHPDGLS